MTYINQKLRKNAYMERIRSSWCRGACAITGCLALSQSAWAFQVELIYDSYLTVAEGSKLNIKLRAFADEVDGVTAQTQCVATGRVLAIPQGENGPVPGQDFNLEGQDFRITFTGSASQAQLVTGETTFDIVALRDNVIDDGEVFRISAENVSVTCDTQTYGGQIPYVSFMDYGPLVAITDSGFDVELEKMALLPELESITVLTMSGAQARNKTLAKQMDFARKKSGPQNRVSMTLDGTPIPIGGPAGDEFSPWGFFLSADFERGDRELPATNSFDFTTNTLVAGVDYRLADNWILGGSLSASQAEADQEARPDQTELDQSAISVFGSLYGDQYYVDALLSYGDNQYDMVRSVMTGAGDAQVVKSLANADTKGSELSFGLGAGYQLDFKTQQLKFFTRLDYIDVDVEGYSEFSGDDTMFVAQINDFKIKSFTSNLGVSYALIVNTGFGVLTPEFGLDYEHQFENDGFNVDGQFVGGQAGEFSISTYDKDANYYNANFALNAVFQQGFSAFISYTDQFGREAWNSQRYALGARMEF